MVYVWVKTAVGAVLATNFSFPLIAVLSNRHLWDEPMAVIAGNTSLICTLFGLFVMLIGIYDVVGLRSVPLCQALQYGSAAAAIIFKAAQSCAAFDQFVAVVYPLQHYAIITRARPWLFTGVWAAFGANVLFGFVDHLLGMETFAEYAQRHGGNSTYVSCRWETGLANIYMIVAELQVVAFSFITAGMLIYTGIVGHRTYSRLTAAGRQRHRRGESVISIGGGGSGGSGGEHKAFFDNYRAFKYIVLVLSLTVTLDIIAPLVRISSRWQPRPTLNGFLHQLRLLGITFEGWAYGLLNVKLRAAYRKMLCGRSTRVASLGTCQCAEPDVVVPEVTPAAVPPLDLQSANMDRF